MIEVGVDVPNASLMVIEHAERFGLSQLHQLRGRVGRGADQSYCVLLTGRTKRPPSRRNGSGSWKRPSDGFKIAEKDLEIRGQGEILGTRQSGIQNFKHGNIVRDLEILIAARTEAEDYLTKRRTVAGNRRDGQSVAAIRQKRRTRLDRLESSFGIVVFATLLHARSAYNSNRMRVIAGIYRGRVFKSPPDARRGRLPTGCVKRFLTFSLRVSTTKRDFSIFAPGPERSGSRRFSRSGFRDLCRPFKEGVRADRGESRQARCSESETEVLNLDSREFHRPRTCNWLGHHLFSIRRTIRTIRSSCTSSAIESILLNDGGMLVVEHHSKKHMPEIVGELRRWRFLKQGETSLSFYENA